MPECIYYKIHTETYHNSEIRSDQQNSALTNHQRPWCAHKHSPATFNVVSTVIGGAGILQCGGRFERCPLTQEQILDFKS